MNVMAICLQNTMNLYSKNPYWDFLLSNRFRRVFMTKWECSTQGWLRKRCRAVFEEQTYLPYLVITAEVLRCTVRFLLKHLEPTIAIVRKGIGGLYQDN